MADLNAACLDVLDPPLFGAVGGHHCGALGSCVLLTSVYLCGLAQVKYHRG